MNVTTIGIDLLVFHYALDRAKLLPFTGALPPCLIGRMARQGPCRGGHEAECRDVNSATFAARAAKPRRSARPYPVRTCVSCRAKVVGRRRIIGLCSRQRPGDAVRREGQGDRLNGLTGVMKQCA
jgi:hypothetical protein